MVVDDDPRIRRLLTYQLGNAGYDICAVERGREAVARLLETKPALVLLDVMLPDMTGWDVCRQIRQRSPVPIIMLTARDADADVVTGLKAGADDYVGKPYSVAQLLARVEAVLRRTPGRGVYFAAAVESVASPASPPAPQPAPDPSPAPVAVAPAAPAAPVAVAPAAPTAPTEQAAPAAPTAPTEQAAPAAPTAPTEQAAPAAPTAPGTASAPTPAHTPARRYNGLGQRLCEARRQRGLTLYQAELASHIRWDFLQAIEREYFNYIPRPQLRPVVMRYAAFLEVDLRDLIPPTQPQPSRMQHWPMPLALAATTAVLMLVLALGLHLL
jgi:CheY-like chemotaxis protein